MTKYARPVTVDSDTAHQTRMFDIVDASVYMPRPSWGVTDDGLLSHIFAPNKAAWVAAGQWFVAIPAGVQDNAVHVGADFTDPASYLNPDGSNGNGEFPPPNGG